MQYVNVNGYRLSRLTLGTVQLGMDYGISNRAGQPSGEESAAIIREACEAGINTLDTSPHYGNAEALTGRWLAAQPDAGMHVITKFRLCDRSLGDREAAKEEAVNSVKASLAALGLPRLPYCLFHKGKDQPIDQVLKVLPSVLAALREQDLVHTGGLSVYYPQEVKPALVYEEIAALQVPFNILDQRLLHDNTMQRLHEAGRTVFARSVFLQGLLFMQATELGGNLVQAAGCLHLLQEMAVAAQMSVAELAFAYVRDLPVVSSLVFGAVQPAQVKQNVAWLQGRPLPADVKDAAARAFRDLPDEILTPGLWVR
jgi:aryl-alcohol dehydrogenase-like predicted oxidoreductase